MLPKRRPQKVVYGKAKTVKQSDLLWNEAITASPIRKQVVLVDTEEEEDDDATAEFAKPAEIFVTKVSEEQVLESINPNKLNVGIVPATTSENLKEEADSVKYRHETGRPSLKSGTVQYELSQTPTKLDSTLLPLTASTPIERKTLTRSNDLTRSHIRFSSRESTPIASESSISTLNSSDLSSIDSIDSLHQLTDAFQGLKTSGRPSIGADSSIASEKDLQDIQSLLSLCHQLEPDEFVDYMKNLTNKCTFRKLGEASFSEVYIGTSNDGQEETVYKVIPFGDGVEEVPIHDIIQELRISSAMADIPGYIKIRGMRIVRGEYPLDLLNAWDEWNELHESESDRPDWYKDTQRYCVVALENGGTDLEHYNISSWSEALMLLKEIVNTLALGEKEREFEHRDLHWGNVLVKQDERTAKVTTTIIDYTLSRARVSDPLSDIAFYGFADRAIFEAEGEDYQFEVYRLMRDSITEGEEDTSTEDWVQFHPTTNALWIHYLVDKLLYAKALKKPALRVSKRHPVLQEDEITAWRTLESTWKLLNPRRKYKANELAIDSAVRVSELMA